MFEGIKETLHREMDILDEKLGGGEALTKQDLDNIDKLAHSLKCLAGYEAMVSGCKDGGGYTGTRRSSSYGRW